MAIVGGASAYIADIGGKAIVEAGRLSASAACYIVRLHGDKITVCKEGEEQPEAEFSLPAEGISAADARLLSDGIRLRGADDVLRLLEDLDIEGYIGIISQ